MTNPIETQKKEIRAARRRRDAYRNDAKRLRVSLSSYAAKLRSDNFLLEQAEAKLAKVRKWAEWEVDDTNRVHDDFDCDRFKRAQHDVLAILDEEER